MSLVRIEIREAIGSLTEKIKKGIDRSLSDIELFGKEELLSRAPVRTGNLRDGISSTKFENTVTFYSEAGYTWHVEKGTSPHTIYPRNAKVLRFEIDGKVIFARKVEHPGTQGKFFIRETGEIIMREAPTMVRMRIDEAVAEKE